MTHYAEFLERRAQHGGGCGFDPDFVPGFLFDFQRALVEWTVQRGRAAIFADCGLGKTPMQLVWAENVMRHENRSVLIVAPLAVSHQVVREAEKFGLVCQRAASGADVIGGARLYVTNYERLHLFDPAAFCGAVCDESSILKNFDGTRRATVQEFVRTLPFRLLCTATAAPNDYTELGTSSEALGELGHMDMLARFFRDERGAASSSSRFCGEAVKWRFKKHAEKPFWRWVTSWARTLRKPSDLGFSDDGFVLPQLVEREYIVKTKSRRPGLLFETAATTLPEQRDERRRTIRERCEKVAELVTHSDRALVWCHLNPEGDLLTRLIPGAVQVAGSDSDDAKEESLTAFANGDIRVLVTKPRIGCYGLNLQRCAHVTFFPSHSYEQYYQGVRRCWRFGQTRPVQVDVVTTEGERGVLDNLRRKAAAAVQMFESLVGNSNDALRILRGANTATTKEEVPSWL